MMLQEAIEEVKRVTGGDEWEPDEFRFSVRDDQGCTAIATILNAVVKGELKHEG